VFDKNILKHFKKILDNKFLILIIILIIFISFLICAIK
jgi:hypothetical protein